MTAGCRRSARNSLVSRQVVSMTRTIWYRPCIAEHWLIMRSLIAARIVCGLWIATLACTDVRSQGTASRDAEVVAPTRLIAAIGEDPAAGPEYQFGSIRSILVTHSGNVWVVDA